MKNLGQKFQQSIIRKIGKTSHTIFATYFNPNKGGNRSCEKKDNHTTIESSSLCGRSSKGETQQLQGNSLPMRKIRYQFLVYFVNSNEAETLELDDFVWTQHLTSLFCDAIRR